MKTTKLFFMAALALMTAACSNDDNDLMTQQPQKAEGITITAQLAPKTNGATTRAVSDGGNKILADWAVNEHIAVLYEVSGTKYAADATITAVDDDDLSATIQFTVEEGTPDNTPCTLVYPYSAAKDDHTGVKDAATLLAAQDGTLNANLDVRVGAGTIQTTTPGLTVTTQPEAQFAIFKFTTKNSDGSATIDVNPLTITIGSQDYVITPASATSTLYAALPPISSQAVTFTATGSDSKTYTASKASVTFAAGKYYQSDIKLTEQAPAAAADNPAPTSAAIDAYTGGAFDWGSGAGSAATVDVTINKFAANDKISILSAKNTNTQFTTSAGGASATFSGTATDDSKFYAVYPYTDGLTLSGDVISGIVIPTSQWNSGWNSTSNYSGWDPKAPIAYATTTGSSLTFHNACAILKVTITGSGTWAIFTISANEPLAGTFSLDTSTGTLTPTSGSKTVTVGTDFSNTNCFETQGGNKTAYIAIAPGTYTNFKLYLTNEDDGHNSKTKSGSVTFEAGKIYDLGSYNVEIFD